MGALNPRLSCSRAAYGWCWTPASLKVRHVAGLFCWQLVQSSSATDTSRFMRNIEASLADVKQVLEAHMAEQAKNKAKK